MFFNFLLIACTNDHTVLKKYIYAVKHTPAKSLQQVSSFETLADLNGSIHDLNTATLKKMHKVQWNTNDMGIKREKQALEHFPLSALKFVGTLKQGPFIWALISQPDNVIVRVGVDEYMGNQEGRILHIEENMITVEERVKASGRKQITSLKL